jgi:O-antigen chain-terminating methyltransferase
MPSDEIAARRHENNLGSVVREKMPEVDIDQIMQKIREEVQRRKQETPSPGLSRSFPSSGSFPTGAGPGLLRPQRTPSFEYKSDYHVRDFLVYHDGDFVRNAYRGLLNREPDPTGYNQYLERLRSGERSKIEILGRIRYSAEGRAKNVRIRGLLVPLGFNLAYRVPMAGYILRLATSLVKLPILLRNIREFEAFTHARFAESGSDLDGILSNLDGQLNRIQGRLEQLADNPWASDLRKEIAAVATTKSDIQETQALGQKLLALELSKAESRRLDALREEIKDLSTVKADANLSAETHQALRGDLEQIRRELLDHKRHILDQQRRLILLLEEARRRLPHPLNENQVAIFAEERDRVLDAMYVSFEDEFRGTREDIKERLRRYLPMIADAAVGSVDFPILDIGSGRGEWLELLTENGYRAKGVDLNGIMVSLCRELGLEVTEKELLEHLRNLPPASLGAITGFHIIEHLPFGKVISFLDESLRTLRPGGMIILETPNPENVLVGSCRFYLDPTHVRPVPSSTLRFLAEARGFNRIRIIDQNPADVRGEAVVADVAEPLRKWFWGPQDYALVGYKT